MWCQLGLLGTFTAALIGVLFVPFKSMFIEIDLSVSSSSQVHPSGPVDTFWAAAFVVGAILAIAAWFARSIVRRIVEADVRRSSYDELVLKSPGLEPLLHVCVGCHIFGLRPGILETHHGDYGWRQSAAKYPELVLNDQCL
jgi:hypothetical protein